MHQRSFHSAWVLEDEPPTGAGAALDTFPWWSFTKTVLAVAALRLVEAGQLELDELRPGKPFTLRQLLLHRAGVPNYGRLTAYHEAVARGEDAWTRERLLEAAGADNLVFEPGTAWSYSNIGYLFVRDAIEEATSLPLGEALRKLVLAPLSMPMVRLATKRSDFADIFWPALRTYDPQWVYHGCLIGSPVDAARLLHSLFKGQLLPQSSIEAMFERSTALGNAIPGRPWTKHGYALGLMSGRVSEAGRAWGHTGSGPHSVNAVYHFPDLVKPITVATFTKGDEEGPAEFEALSIAIRMQG